MASNLLGQARAFYRRMFRVHGIPATHLKNNGSGFDTVNGLKVTLKGYAPNELIGDIFAGDTRCLLDPETVTTIPVAKKDRLTVLGKTYSVEFVDPNTRQIAGNVLAYELRLRG